MPADPPADVRFQPFDELRANGEALIIGGLPVGPLESALVAAAASGRIPCATVFRVAAEQGVPIAQAGRAVQRLGIKLTGCQLGCF